MCSIDQMEAVDIDEPEDFEFAKVVEQYLERNSK
jgi:CMP-N-acetylneuraminic acid synthetase